MVAAVSELGGGAAAMARCCGSLGCGKSEREKRQKRVRASQEGERVSESGERAPDLFSLACGRGDTVAARSGER